MNWRSCDLREELETAGAGVVCLTGGGGKTTLLHALGVAFAAAGASVLCTTSTRMARPARGVEPEFVAEDDPSRLSVPPGTALLAARPTPPGGDPAKVYGYAPAELDALAHRRAAEWIVVEADGAAGRPLKAPAEHEPVIPASARAVVAVVGLRCVGKPLAAETVFRMERVAALTGLAPGDPVTPEAVAALANHPLGLFKNCPAGAARFLFLNQADLDGATEAGAAIVRAIANNGYPNAPTMLLGSLHKDGLRCAKPTLA